MPVLVGDVLRVWADATDAGVVDDDVEPAEVAHDRCERLVDLRALRHVGRIGTRLDAGPRELVGGDARRVPVDLEHRHGRTRLGELLGDASAEARPDPVTIATRPSSTAI